jgi:hypothetical protein
MELSEHVESVRRELASLTKFATEDVVRVADLLTEALDSPVRLVLLDVLSAAAAEITAELEGIAVELRLNGGEPEFVTTGVPAAGQAPPAGQRGSGQDGGPDDSGTARITLRLSESLKARVESEASATGLSVNAWLSHAAIRALDSSASQAGGRPRSGFGQRYTGYARS